MGIKEDYEVKDECKNDVEEGKTACRKIIVTLWKKEGDKYQDTLKIEAMEDLEDLEDFMMYLYESSFNQSIPGGKQSYHAVRTYIRACG